jgi:iron complex outermembrane receptor protein
MAILGVKARLLSAVAAAAFPAGVMAQTAPDSGMVTTATAVDNGQSDQLNDIIVTARKRAEDLKNVPISIVAVGQAQIASLNAKSLEDLNGVTPNAHIAPDGTLTIRGISSDARNAGFEAGAAVYIDGVYQGRPIGNDQDLVDISQVEILRGPQGTLYGKNTTAGAFSLTTVRPGDQWQGRGEVQYGEQNDFRAAGYVAGPLTNTLGIKISAYRRKSDGYQKDLTVDATYGNFDAVGGRAELRLKSGPVDLSLRGDYTNDKSVPAREEPVAGFAAAFSPGRDTVDNSLAIINNRKGGGLSLTGDIDLGGGYTLTSISAWRRLTSRLVSDDDWSPADIVYHDFRDRNDQVSEEIRLTSPSRGPFNYIVGAYYLHETVDSDRPILIDDFAGFKGYLTDVVAVKTNSFAVFANADYHFTGALTLNLGLRYTNERKSLGFVQINTVPLAYPDLTISDRFVDSDLSPTASLSYKLSPDATVYVRYSKGFKSGGWNPDITSTGDIGFKPEKVDNFEAGLRARLLQGRLTFNATAYYMNYDDLQVSQFKGTFTGYVITNAGKARIKGIEADAQVRPARWLTLGGGLAYNDARYVDFDSGISDPADPGNDINYAGQMFTNSPAFSGYLSADIDLPLTTTIKLVAHGDARYQSRIYFDDPRTVSVVGPYAQNGYALLNGRVGIALSNGIEADLFVTNITNRRPLQDRHADALGLGLILDTYLPPRQIGGRVSLKF